MDNLDPGFYSCYDVSKERDSFAGSSENISKLFIGFGIIHMTGPEA